MITTLILGFFVAIISQVEDIILSSDNFELRLVFVIITSLFLSLSLFLSIREKLKHSKLKNYNHLKLSKIVNENKSYFHGFSDISSGQINSENINTSGVPKDIYNIKEWGYSDSFIWRIFINNGMNYEWDIGNLEFPDKAILVVSHIALTGKINYISDNGQILATEILRYYSCY